MSPLVQAVQYKRGHGPNVFAAFGSKGFNADGDGRLWHIGQGSDFVACDGDWIVREKSGRLICVTNSEFKQRYQEVK